MFNSKFNEECKCTLSSAFEQKMYAHTFAFRPYARFDQLCDVFHNGVLLFGLVNTEVKLSLTFGMQATDAKETNACRCFRRCGIDIERTPKVETVRSVRELEKFGCSRPSC